MKLKPDTLCRVVGGPFVENHNAIVRTVVFRADAGGWEVESLQPMKWYVTTGFALNLATGSLDRLMSVACRPAGQHGMVREDWLRPLYDGDAEDEMLRLVGKPKGRDETLVPKRQVEWA